LLGTHAKAQPMLTPLFKKEVMKDILTLKTYLLFIMSVKKVILYGCLTQNHYLCALLARNNKKKHLGI
jgi:hypothetical protein